MTVYAGDKSDYLRQSIDSMLAQTVPTDDFVLVKDGMLTPELEETIASYIEAYSGIFNVVSLPQNVGLGAALMEGLPLCRNELVARMDADDISLPDRCRKELEAFEKNESLSIVGSFTDEFSDSPDLIIRTRQVPLENTAILLASRRRNPFNHPSVMFRKSAVIGAGNYSPMRTNQDVELWVRMLNMGYKGENIGESLIKFRFDEGTYLRRKNRKNVSLMISLWSGFLKKGFCSPLDFLSVFIAQAAIFILPIPFVKLAYKIFR